MCLYLGLFPVNEGWQITRMTHTLSPLIPFTPSFYKAKNPTPHSGHGRKQGTDIRYRARQPSWLSLILSQTQPTAHGRPASLLPRQLEPFSPLLTNRTYPFHSYVDLPQKLLEPSLVSAPQPSFSLAQTIITIFHPTSL